MTTHTPGPWVVDTLATETHPHLHLPKGPIHQILAQVGPYPATICTVEEYNEVFERLDRAADARLLAASPDMLAALKQAHGYLRNPKFDAGMRDAMAFILETAIRKAEGK